MEITDHVVGGALIFIGAVVLVMKKKKSNVSQDPSTVEMKAVPEDKENTLYARMSAPIPEPKEIRLKKYLLYCDFSGVINVKSLLAAKKTTRITYCKVVYISH